MNYYTTSSLLAPSQSKASCTQESTSHFVEAIVMARTAIRKYPKDFVKKAKTSFPKWSQLHRALDNASEVVGRQLDDSRRKIEPQYVLDCLNRGQPSDLQELKSKATRLVLIEELYGEWRKIAEKMF